VCMCLLLQDLVQSCLRVVGVDIGGHVLRETTSRGLCGLVCATRDDVDVVLCLLLQYLIQSCARGGRRI
jgi:hypothetical protein